MAKIETVDAIVKATCVLHNFLRRCDGVSNVRRYMSQGDVDADDDERVMRCRVPATGSSQAVV